MTEKKEYTTASGRKITILSVPPFLLDKVMGAVKYPEAPTYKAVTAGGEEELHYHDETTVVTDEEKAAWEKYKRDLENAKLRENELMMNAMFLKGIDVDMSGEHFTDWIEEQEFLGIELPTSKPALKVHYITTEILSDLNDLSKIMGLIMQSSGVAEEVVDAALNSFQGAVSGRTADQPGTETGELEA